MCCCCRYIGRLKSNGRVFDKTDKKPFAFRLGESQACGVAAASGVSAGSKQQRVDEFERPVRCLLAVQCSHRPVDCDHTCARDMLQVRCSAAGLGSVPQQAHV